MQNAPDDTGRDSNIEHLPDRATPGNRTAAAAREFLKALGGDLVALAAAARRYLTFEREQWPSMRLPAIAAIRRSATWANAGRQVLRRWRWMLGGIALIGLGGALGLAGAMLWALHDLPLDRSMSAPEKPTLLIEAANGEPLGRVGPLRAAPASLQDYPSTLIQAVLSIEDRRFYHHFGVDPLGILRAARRNAAADEIVEGGSTITQQLVKIRYLGNDQTYVRKLREALTAMWMETHLGKDEILTRYLDSIYMGGGAYGMTAAARLYFDKRPADLTLAEAATLAGVVRAPTQFNPLRHPEAAQARAATVLDAMVADGVIDAQAANAAKASPAKAKVSPQLAESESWFADWVGQRAAADVTAPRTVSVRVRTTLMPNLQRLGQDVLNRVLAAQGPALGVSQGALVAMRPDGAVLAMVGGRDYGASQFNRAVDANRQPGSAFKLFVYMAALRKGYTPQDTIDAGPVDIKGWEPENYGNEHYGRITLAEAFAKSVNTAAVRLAMDVGLDQVIAAARDLGIDAPLSPYPSLALGAAEVSLLDLTRAFASVRANRMRVQPWGVAAIGAADGTSLRAAGAPLASGRTLDPYRNSLVSLLRGVIEHGTGRAAALNGFAAGKTGTSQNYRNAWFIGFNDALVVGVWVGNDDNSPMKRVVGGMLPASIWKQFMTEATPLIGQPEMSVAAAPATDAVLTSDAGARPQSDNPPSEASSDRTAAGSCAFQACASAYQSFRASDCSYQSYFGQRRSCALIERSSNPAAERMSREATDARAQAQCNVERCAQHYSSFNASDCTYQPYDGGPRQFCTK
jgi:penicillin-binding protein 1A